VGAEGGGVRLASTVPLALERKREKSGHLKEVEGEGKKRSFSLRRSSRNERRGKEESSFVASIHSE